MAANEYKRKYLPDVLKIQSKINTIFSKITKDKTIVFNSIDKIAHNEDFSDDSYLMYHRFTGEPFSCYLLKIENGILLVKEVEAKTTYKIHFSDIGSTEEQAAILDRTIAKLINEN